MIDNFLAELFSPDLVDGMFNTPGASDALLKQFGGSDNPLLPSSPMSKPDASPYPMMADAMPGAGGGNPLMPAGGVPLPTPLFHRPLAHLRLVTTAKRSVPLPVPRRWRGDRWRPPPARPAHPIGWRAWQPLHTADVH